MKFSLAVVEMRRSEPTNSILAVLDGKLVEDSQLPVHMPWATMEKLPGGEQFMTVLLTAIQVRFFF